MRSRRAFAIAAVITLAGCAAGPGSVARPTAPAPATQTGVSNGLAGVASTYALVAVDDHPLPYSRDSKDATTAPTQIVSGTLDLKADGTFTMSTTYRAVDAQGERLFDGRFNGACAPDGDNYRLYWNGGGETALTVSGNTVTVNNNGTRYKYLRRA